MFNEAVKHVPARAGEDTVNVFIETPRGSRQKMNLHESGLFRIGLELPEGMRFPFAFGFVPQTRAPDGDPLDILLLCDGELPAGSLIEARLIGVLKMENEEDGALVRNDRVVAIATMSRIYNDLADLAEARKEFVWDMQLFFESYNRMIERGYEFKGQGDRNEAISLFEESVLQQ
ncbi:inorganic diphosphatase [Paracoccus sediminicola]|uniref:inorganic diphosphatase n=1 Tax=Paracoccus sediminicola TaxID=3017783 RepID=UPI0022F0C362|nr:inorganic diphosphatase [Paracoccus sediminicola]WBU57241.1 inorganic diphosphatase [Paracoccus sediminicola]